MLLSPVYFVREVIEILAENAQCKRGLFGVVIKQEGSALQIKVARDLENIFYFELCVNKVK